MQEYENIRLKREDVIKFAQYANLNEKDLESLIEIILQYSVIAHKAYNKFNTSIVYE